MCRGKQTHLWSGEHVQAPGTHFTISRDSDEVMSILGPNNIYTVHGMLQKHKHGGSISQVLFQNFPLHHPRPLSQRNWQVAILQQHLTQSLELLAGRLLRVTSNFKPVSRNT